MLAKFMATPAQNTLMTVGAMSLAIGMIVSFLTLKSTSLAGNIAGVAALSAIQGGAMAMSSAAMQLGQRAGRQSAGVAAGGVGAIASKVRSAASNTLSAASQRAAFRSGQQKNLE